MRRLLLSIFAVCLMSCAGSAYADSKCCDKKSADCPTCRDGCCKCKKDCCCCEDGALTASAELLFWHPCQDTLFAQVVSGTTNSYHWAEYDWNVGYRTTMHYSCGCSDWDLEAIFTILSADADTTFLVPATGVVTILARDAGAAFVSNSTAGTTSVIAAAVVPDASTDFKISHDLDYHVFDVTAGFHCCACEGFEFRPYGGFRGLWIDQQTVYSWIVTAGTPDTMSPAAGDGLFWDSEYHAFGMTAGLESKYNICCVCGDFSIFSKMGGSVVVGDDERTITLRSATALNRQWHFNEPCHVNFGYEVALGLMYEFCWCDTKLAASIGYEFHYWSDVANIFHGSDEFVLHGIFLKGAMTY